MSFTNTEYQHFIPQFILKNYSYPFKCPNTEQKGKKKCKCKHEKDKFPGDLVVNCVDLTPPRFRLETYPRKRIFGAPNMYNDPAKTASHEQRRIETMFGKMESQASTIFRRIVKNHEAGDAAVTLTRIERDLLRKFLFLLKYRGSGFHQRFYHDKPEDYCSNDRELLLEYMKEHHFSTPRDVWYHNLETIMNLEMDPERKWIRELPCKMFSDDAYWFIMHCEMYYMAICTPSEVTDEFILTDNCYNVFEGPSTFSRDATGKTIAGYHAGYHEFAPISPRLIIVLRCLALPNPEEDYNWEINQARNDALWSSFQRVYGEDTKSMLEDLPIKKCRNNYSEIINGEAHPVAGYDGKFRPTDKFHFTYHPIKNGHVNTINNIFLDNAHGFSTIAYRNKENIKQILESYVSGPCDSHKIVGGDDPDSRYSFMRGLETLARHLGSQKPLVWRTMKMVPKISMRPSTDKQLEFRRVMQRLKNGLSHDDPVAIFFELYKKLGGKALFNRDVPQAGKMVHFQSVIESLSVGCSEMIQLRNRLIISTMFMASYCSRYWLYLKLLRKEQFGYCDATQDEVDLLVIEEVREGPEDIFAQTSQLYTENALNNLMRTTVLNDIVTRNYMIENLWIEAFSTKYIVSHALFYSVIFARPGKIRDCGIPDVELLAKREEEGLRTEGIRGGLFHLPFASEEEHLELMVRVHVRSKFQVAMGGKAEDGLLRELEDVFFRLTFPTPPLD
ncbi:hypothetical protein THAR02_00139 [Trichoderma harzianum]|uniref:Uncharacterized protein n=1 Tax=Trichoderma harzianum TaxID=5544 RepID=A0A0F9XSQ1_TRIHA|nr:hypothetical protein THAR02_00139 [Trichoderma harzianum]